MESFMIEGVTVEFPFVPYDCQKAYMQRVIQSLQQKSNAILESPTGTGKTLCLLCSTLAWRRSYVAQQELKQCCAVKESHNVFANSITQELNSAAGMWQESTGGMLASQPKIIYASRTHSQLSQVIQELKATSYRPKVCILGSREQMCIHPQVMKQDTNTAKIHMCRAKVSARTCFYYNNVENKKADSDFNGSILDIEDLVKLGHKHKVCPYYVSKEFLTSADIIFMPYNYLLDNKLRKRHGIDLNGNIVILDEAHNVEKLCEESASFDFTSVELSSCIQETGELLRKVMECENAPQQFSTDEGSVEDFDATAIAVLKTLFVNLEQSIQTLCDSGGDKGVTKSGIFIFDLFREVHITMDTKDELIELVDKIISYFSKNQTAMVNKVAALGKFNDILNIVFSSESTTSKVIQHMTQCYKVHIRRVTDFKQKKSSKDFWANESSNKKGFVFSYWCFNPGFSMKELVAKGVRSIILTSGTLAPLESFKSEMQIDFPIQLENPHVIEKHQMQVSVITKGCDGIVLNSSYKNRFNISYILSLGNTIVNFFRMVPHGVLIFFPSYPVMNNCIETWQQNGITSRMEQYKTLFTEPKGKIDFIQAMDGFYSTVQDPTLNGAAFFAVCRGKVSEGLDFANNNGRAVVITGLPFPPRMEPKVMLKMEYLDEVRSKQTQMLSGQQWYRQQASRAVNQAIGRVIRHKHDYGVILLCDTRFTNTDARAQLPSWVRPYVKVYDKFGHAVKDINNFFKVATQSLPIPIFKKLEIPTRDLPQVKPQRKPSTTTMVKANQTDSHVPSLKKNEVHTSDARLRIMYEQPRRNCSVQAKGLLQALHQADELPACDNMAASSSWCSPHNNTGFSKNMDRKRKKIVIVNQSAETSVSRGRQGPKKESVTSAQRYLQEVRQVLSKDSYKQFSEQMQEYKKDEDCESLIATLASLFTNVDSQYHLFRDFYKFVRPHHKKQFSEVSYDLTGLSCNYKPEHSLNIKKYTEGTAAEVCNTEKRRRIDGSHNSTE